MINYRELSASHVRCALSNEEWSMQSELDMFVHSENIRSFISKLADETYADRREMLTKLLAEEMARAMYSTVRV